MAVDTRQKRMSMMSFGQPIRFMPMFEADGTVNDDDKYHMLNLYSGIALDAPAAGGDVDYMMLTGMFEGTP